MYVDYEDNSNLNTDYRKKNIIINFSILLLIIIIGILLLFLNKKDKYEIDIKEKEIIVERGNHYQIKTKEDLEYKIADLNIARINDEGNIIGLKEGSTNLIITSDKTNDYKVVKVSVKKNEFEKAEEVEVETEEIKEEKNEKKIEEKINPVVEEKKEEKNNSIVEEQKEEKTNPVVEKNKEEEINPVIEEEKEEKIVNPKNIVLNINNKELYVGEELLLTATIVPNNSTNKNIIWTSSNNNIATVENGKVKTKKTGNVIISAKTENGKEASCSIIVKEKIIEASSITLNKTSEVLNIGDTIELKETITPSNATNKIVTWTSTNSSVASVDSNGIVKGKKEGTSLIIVKTSNEKTASCQVKVTKKEEIVDDTKLTKFQVPLRTNDGSILMGGDPFVKYYNGYYYYLSTKGNDILISISKNLQDIDKPEKIVKVYKNPYNRVIWAPELHYIQGRWYIYFTNSNGDDYYDRKSYVLRSKTNDPLGEYEYMGQIKDSKHDYYAIDGTPLEWNGQLYFVYSGMPSKKKTGYQNLYIAHMSNPWTINSERVEIASATYSWEKKNAHINEGPEILIKNNTLHIIYSANGAQSKYYCLGMLTYNGGNILSKKSWTKSKTPLFESGNGVYGVGHASFTTSRDNKEDWIVYHAYANSNSSTIKNWKRSIRIQKFTWNGTTPVFGKPIANDSYLTVPSGSI